MMCGVGAVGLTPAEARLAGRLAAGDRPDEAAEALAMTKNTARIQLRVVLAVTGTGRQGELMALLAAWRGDAGNSISIVHLVMLASGRRLHYGARIE
jgi:DNA-binding CsgD family transcriptional regulator